MPVAIEDLRRQLVERLPELRRWSVNGVNEDWDFRRTRAPLRPLDDDEWPMLLIFGEESLDGGASPFIAVHADTGAVHGLDLERGEGAEVFLLNSSVPRFIEMFLAFDGVFRAGAPASGLMARVRAIDPLAFDGGEWRPFAEYVLETLEPAAEG